MRLLGTDKDSQLNVFGIFLTYLPKYILQEKPGILTPLPILKDVVTSLETLVSEEHSLEISDVYSNDMPKINEEVLLV